MESDPPLQEAYRALLEKEGNTPAPEIEKIGGADDIDYGTLAIGECKLPVIDLSWLQLGEVEREECKREIAKASKEWGFFQVVNHGISQKVLERMREEEVKLFRQPFHIKSGDKFMNFSAGTYRWGTQSATHLRQLSWSEAFHVQLSDIFSGGTVNSFSSTMKEYAEACTELAKKLAQILAEKIGNQFSSFEENLSTKTCYLRMNRYPACPMKNGELFGLVPHTDSDFLTIVHQDQIGGLQLLRNGKWLAVKPNPEALIINIGDLFQAWSNNVYKSVEHRVVPNQESERFSIAYLLCPSFDCVIQSVVQPSAYRHFSFGEYRRQVEEDVRKFGNKIGLSRFLV